MSASTWISKMLEAGNKKSLASFFASWEFGKMLVDGNLAHNIMFRAPSGKLVGTDYNGNKYYENNETAAYGRRRWIVYKNTFNYDASTVPPEWHGWLNYINDYNPTQHEFKKPIYLLEQHGTKTGTTACYQPKGSWFNEKKRNWKKYEAWSPAGKA